MSPERVGPCPPSPWEKEWRAFETRHQTSPKAPKTEDERRVASLPDNVLQYLALGGMARNETYAEEARTGFKEMQVNILSEMQDNEKDAMCKYIEWKAKQPRITSKKPI